MARNNGNLTAKQKQAVNLLVNANMTYTQICEEVGINMKTLWRWRNEPEFAHFQAEYQRLRDEQWLATVEIARRSAMKLCAEGNQRMVEFILKNDGLNPTQKVDADVNMTAQVVFVDDLDEEDEDQAE